MAGHILSGQACHIHEVEDALGHRLVHAQLVHCIHKLQRGSRRQRAWSRMEDGGWMDVGRWVHQYCGGLAAATVFQQEQERPGLLPNLPHSTQHNTHPQHPTILIPTPRSRTCWCISTDQTTRGFLLAPCVSCCTWIASDSFRLVPWWCCRGWMGEQGTGGRKGRQASPAAQLAAAAAAVAGPLQLTDSSHFAANATAGYPAEAFSSPSERQAGRHVPFHQCPAQSAHPSHARGAPTGGAQRAATHCAAPPPEQA